MAGAILGLLTLLLALEAFGWSWSPGGASRTGLRPTLLPTMQLLSQSGLTATASSVTATVQVAVPVTMRTPQTPPATIAPTGAPSPTPAATPTTVPVATLVGAGDIASCDSNGDEATAALLDTIPGTIFAAGDTVYLAGTDSEYADCFHPSWGRHKERIRPAAGNHEYQTPGASGYFNYFGAAAGDPTLGYYSYDLGGWHVVVLNTNCWEVRCAAGTAQEQWLRADLAGSPTPCTVAYGHHPRWSSGSHGPFADVQPLWQALYDAGVELYVTGHDHLYERFAPMDGMGGLDLERGVRQFVVGTGGSYLLAGDGQTTNSEVLNADTFGVLRFTLRADGYDWAFVPIAGSAFSDGGSDRCH